MVLRPMQLTDRVSTVEHPIWKKKDEAYYSLYFLV